MQIVNLSQRTDTYLTTSFPLGYIDNGNALQKYGNTWLTGWEFEGIHMQIFASVWKKELNEKIH